MLHPCSSLRPKRHKEKVLKRNYCHNKKCNFVLYRKLKIIKDFDFDEQIAADKFFSSNTFSILSDSETKLYEKRWTEYMKYLYGIIIVIFAASLFGCQNEFHRIHDNVMLRYSKEDINSFYEYCFNIGDTIGRWDKDILYWMEGDTIPTDKQVMSDIVSRINQIGLPIKIGSASERLEANMIIVFEDKQNFDPQSNGLSTNYYSRLKINHSKIQISNHLRGQYRSNILQHEILHALGFLNHVTTSINSVLFSDSDSLCGISVRDEQMLRMLYEPVWDEVYTRLDFETIFYKELYHVNSAKKVREYIGNEGIDSSILNAILQHGFLLSSRNPEEGRLWKLINYSKVFLGGDFPEYLKDTLRLMIEEINAVSPQFRLVYWDENIPMFGIFFEFVQDDLPPSEMPELRVHSYAFPDLTTKIRAVYRIKHSVTYSSAHTSELSNILGRILYHAISLRNYTREENPFEYVDGKLQLTPYHKELLKVLYANELPYNLKKEDFEKALK